MRTTREATGVRSRWRCANQKRSLAKIANSEAVLGSSLELAFSISSTRDFVASQATSSLLRCNVVLVAPRAVGLLGQLGALQ